MADKPIQLITGNLKEVEGTVVSVGVGDAGTIPALDPAGKLDISVMPTGIGADTASLVTSENLAAGDFVNVYDNVGTPTARKADATTTGKECDGFVLAATTSPAVATVYFDGSNNQLTSLTGGDKLYLSTTAGQSTTTPPSATGNVVQSLGKAYSTVAMTFQPTAAVELA